MGTLRRVEEWIIFACAFPRSSPSRGLAGPAPPDGDFIHDHQRSVLRAGAVGDGPSRGISRRAVYLGRPYVGFKAGGVGMRGRLPIFQEITGSSGSVGILTRFLPVGAASHEMQSWLSPLILTCIGVLDARRALAILRQDEPPGPDSLPGLVSETAAALGIPIALEVDDVPGALDSDAGLMLYRVVQEALTNVAKHAGRGARVTVRLAWASGGVAVSIADQGGDGVDAGLPSGGFGLTS